VVGLLSFWSAAIYLAFAAGRMLTHHDGLELELFKGLDEPETQALSPDRGGI
jgi:hypothetical protein